MRRLKEQNINAELCKDTPNIDVRGCLRLYKPRDEIKHHTALFGKCQKLVIINMLDYLHVTEWG